MESNNLSIKRLQVNQTSVAHGPHIGVSGWKPQLALHLDVGEGSNDGWTPMGASLS